MECKFHFLGALLFKPQDTLQKTLDSLPRPFDKAFTCGIMQLNLLTTDKVIVKHGPK